MKRYVGKFINPAGQSCRVNVYDDNYTGDAMELYMSPTPIVISESAQDLLTEPIMASSAVLTFISDPALEGLVVEDEMQCAIEVLADDTLVWHGYLNPEVRDDLLPSITSEVTLNATSALGLMSTRKISAEGEPLRSIAQYIAEGLQACGNVLTDICLPSVAKIAESDGYNSLWTLQAQRDNFYTREEVTSTDDELYDEQSWADVLSNFMTLFGLTMYEDYASGCIMLLSRDADATYCRMTLADFAAGTGVESYALPDSTDMASLPMWGTSHSTSTYAPVKKIKVMSNINSMEGAIVSSERDINGTSLHDLQYILVDSINQAQKRYVFSGKIVDTDTPEISALAYVAVKDGITGADIIKQISNLTDNDITNALTDTSYKIGENTIQALEMGGAIPVRGIWALDSKISAYSKATKKVKSWRIKNSTSAWSAPVLNLEAGTEVLRYINGGIRLKAPFALGLYARFSKPKGDKNISPIKFLLRVGNKYWSGSSWVDQATYFTPEYDYAHNGRWEVKTSVDDDTLADYDGLSGIIAPSADGIQVAEGILLVIAINDSWVGDRKNGEFYLTDLSLSVSSNQDNIQYDDYTDEVKNFFTTIVYRDNGVGKDMDDISINVHSDQGYQQARSYLWQGEQTVSSLVYGSTTQIPEHWLANHLKSIYCRRRKRYKLTVEGIDYKTNTRYSYEGITYTTVARSVDPYNNTTTLTLERATKSANL